MPKKQTKTKTKKKDSKPKEIVINNDFSYVSPADGKTYTMTVKEKLFSDYYLEFKGDGVDAVFEAGYKVKSARVASAIAYENLRKPHIIAYVNSKLEEAGFNDDGVYKQHLFLVNQHADLKSKAKGIDMFYKLKGSYAPDKSVNLNIDQQVMSDEDIKKLALELNNQLKNGHNTGKSKSGNGSVAGAVGKKV